MWKKEYKGLKDMVGSKVLIGIATIAGILLGLLLLSVSYLLTPDQSNPEGLSSFIASAPPLQNQIFVAFMWIGFALLISISAVGVLMLAHRFRKKDRK